MEKKTQEGTGLLLHPTNICRASALLELQYEDDLGRPCRQTGEPNGQLLCGQAQGSTEGSVDIVRGLQLGLDPLVDLWVPHPAVERLRRRAVNNTENPAQLDLRGWGRGPPIHLSSYCLNLSLGTEGLPHLESPFRHSEPTSLAREGLTLESKLE